MVSAMTSVPREDSRQLRLASAVAVDVDSGDESDELDENIPWPSKEAVIRPLPNPVPKKPSDRAAHRRVVEQSYRMAHIIVAAETADWVVQGRCCIVGLLIVELTRGVAWYQSLIPGRSVFGIHWLTTTSDTVCLLSSLPFYLQGTRGKCVMFGCVGPMVTLVFSMCLADAGALLAYLAIARPRPLSADANSRSLYDVMQTLIGAWEFLLFASVALQVTLCACCWRIYRALRMIGLYPPGQRPMTNGPKVEVSYLEIVCEADDARHISKNVADCNATDDETCCRTRLLEEPEGDVSPKVVAKSHPPVELSRGCAQTGSGGV